jgi:hypothetical protein
VSRASAAKRQREKDRKERAEVKAARRAERGATPPSPRPDRLAPADQTALLAELADLHTRFEDGDVGYDDFTAAKDDITRRLQVD